MTAAGFSRYALAAVLVGALAGVSSGGSARGVAVAETALLSGTVVSSTGERLAGVPVRARRANSTIAVTVYTSSDGDYVFPEWSHLTPGSHSISIELPDFEPSRQQVTLTAGSTARGDFTLRPRQPSIADAIASEIFETFRPLLPDPHFAREVTHAGEECEGINRGRGPCGDCSHQCGGSVSAARLRWQTRSVGDLAGGQ